MRKIRIGGTAGEAYKLQAALDNAKAGVHHKVIVSMAEVAERELYGLIHRMPLMQGALYVAPCGTEWETVVTLTRGSKRWFLTRIEQNKPFIVTSYTLYLTKEQDKLAHKVLSDSYKVQG